MQIRRYILPLMLCLLPIATMAQDEMPNTEVSSETMHQEISTRMKQYIDELNELTATGNSQVTFSASTQLSMTYINVLKDKINLLEERYNSINIRWTTFTQAMQMDIADNEDLMTLMTNVEQLKQNVADSIAVKKQCCNALQDFVLAEEQLAGQDTIYKQLYHEAFELSLLKKLTPKLEKLKAREQTNFAQLQSSYQKAQQACEIVPALNKHMPTLNDTFTNIQMVSKKIQETEYKPFIQRIKDYLMGLACVAVILLFINMLYAKYKQIKTAREQAKKYEEMMRRNSAGGGGEYPII